MIGKTLGHYRVGEQLGRGGMGEVYLADDLNLNRKVALKFLPDAFAADPERMVRFEREAKLLASLNHPNIAAIHGLEEAEGKRFLVLELVEGETLAQRLSKEPLPVEEALAVCRQIAEGLEAAHEKGVIHRDLKPANVMITDGDKVKILDFGLAKALSSDTPSVDASQSPTITKAMTQPGIVLGTAAYMSPEQAKGKAVDKRADIWAFGCILYECLTGKRVFEGETVTETLAAILKGEPDWQALPAATPPNIRFVLRRCLEKEMSRRFRDAADVQIQIEEVHENYQPAAVPAKYRWLPWAIASLFLMTTAVLAPVAYQHLREKEPVAPEPMRFQIAQTENTNLPGAGSLSPDGRWLASIDTGAENSSRISLRAVSSLESRPLAGTENAQGTPYFWSSDSRFVVFWTGEKLVKVDISSGQSQTLCNYGNIVIGGAWSRDGVIIFGSNTPGVGLMQVPAGGGNSSPVTVPDVSHQETMHKYPSFLSDGRHFLYWRASRNPEYDGLYIGSLDAKPAEQSTKRLMPTSYGTIYVPPSGPGAGYLLFLREGMLMAQRFDERRLELVGEAVSVAEGVGSFRDTGYFAASANGVLVYKTGAGVWRVTLVNRRGEVIGTAGEPGDYPNFALSPEGSRAAVTRQEVISSAFGSDLWLLDFTRGINTRFTFGRGNNRSPVWSPDGSKIIFSSNRDGVFDLYQKAASGVSDEEPLLKSDEDKHPTSWSHDGRYLLYTSIDPKTKYDLWVLPLEGDRKPVPFLKTEFSESDGSFSPDMHWVAYTSDESGKSEIYIRSFTKASGATSETGGKWQISVGGGSGPRWRGDGKELYYRAPDGKVMAVEITPGTAFRSGTPKPLFQARPDEGAVLRTGYSVSNWDVAPDGTRFLLSTPAKESSPTPVTVVLSWTSLLKK
jgi:serine/threonine protein kinase/Tol biopolymer transport system component